MLSAGSRISPASIGKRVALWLFGMIVILGFYGLGKLGAIVDVATVLPLTALDRAVPFVPWTVWLYGTITWVSLAAWLSVPSRADAARMLSAIVLASMSCCAVFLLFPTTFPRELYPLVGPDSATLRELARLREADSPSNCLPSLHVALAWAIALTWASAREHRGLRAIAVVWALAISVTTVTTKQHFVVDVPAGAAVGVFAWWGARTMIAGSTSTPAWAVSDGLALRWDTHQKAIAKLRRSAEAYQWSLDEIEWPSDPLPPLDPTLERLINELIYIEEIAGMNFGVLARAATSDDLRALYRMFEDEERRHAEGLRKVLALHGAPLRPPGLGNSLVLHEFDALDPGSNADVLLIATANPVFETMLDAGTVPFLRTHPALRSAWFDDFIKRITRDESAHLAVNWMVVREAGERHRGLAGLALLFNPSIVRGMISVPFMSLDVYSLAHRLGYRFETLLPAFGKLWRLHRRYPELRWFPLWWMFRLFTAAGAIATFACVGLSRMNLMFVRFWTTFTKLTDWFARAWFGKRLLAKRGLPVC
ncbi:phosphatase PAP2 family protein [Nannocystaceae bacterium ST9]